MEVKRDSIIGLEEADIADPNLHPKLQRCREYAASVEPDPRYVENSAHEKIVLEQLKLFESQ
ncbi:hypothetical protein ETH_00035475, partial [Eimeria tenella]